MDGRTKASKARASELKRRETYQQQGRSAATNNGTARYLTIGRMVVVNKERTLATTNDIGRHVRKTGSTEGAVDGRKNEQ